MNALSNKILQICVLVNKMVKLWEPSHSEVDFVGASKINALKFPTPTTTSTPTLVFIISRHKQLDHEFRKMEFPSSSFKSSHLATSCVFEK